MSQLGGETPLGELGSHDVCMEGGSLGLGGIGDSGHKGEGEC